jgi:hypothetical protein
MIEDTDGYLESARVHAWVGNTDAAFEYLERHLDPESLEFTEVAAKVIWNPFFRTLHADPRWTALREQAGLSEERLGAIRIHPPAIGGAANRLTADDGPVGSSD